MVSISKMLSFLKVRFDLGSIFLTIANFVLLIIATAPKFIDFFNIKIAHGEMIFTLVAIPVAFLIMLSLGQILIWMRYMENYAEEVNKRNPIYEEILTEIRSLKNEQKKE